MFGENAVQQRKLQRPLTISLRITMRLAAPNHFPLASVSTLLIVLLSSCQLRPAEQQTSLDCARGAANSSDSSSGSAGPVQKLSQTCLYADIERQRISPQLRRFTPNYQLWSDGANKTRWIYLPPGSQIDTRDPDHWRFPIGTQIFKEFRQSRSADAGSTSVGDTAADDFSADDFSADEIRVETRHLTKVSDARGYLAWSIATYAWQPDQRDAVLLLKGAQQVLGTRHNIPSKKDCITCHKGNRDFILGFEALQLSDAQAPNAFGHGPKRLSKDPRGMAEWTLQSLLDANRLSHAIAQPTLPGNKIEQQALGYMHANCGNCHNPRGHAADRDAEHLKLRHKLGMLRLEDTDVYRTAVNQPTQNFTLVPFIAMGAAYEEMAIHRSAVFVRMNSTDEDYRMPAVAREQVDYQGLALIQSWLKTLPTPPNYDFDAASTGIAKLGQLTPFDASALEGPGLQLLLRFKPGATPPPSVLVYWPEDKSLKARPVMDHRHGDFTESLIVGQRGARMSLRNSDDVGHTIYVKDKRQGVNWRLNYMPPLSRFEQELFWDEGVFVELRCRLHEYMSAWAGSISSRYHKILSLDEEDSSLRFAMQDYPEGFSQVRIWMPHFKPIHTQIRSGETQRFNLKRGAQIWGELIIRRSPKG